MIRHYVRSKYKSILLFALFICIFCLVAYLYHMPLDALLYAITLCLFVSTALMIYSYFRYRQKAEMLADVRARIQFGPEELPQPSTAMDEEYHKIIRYLYKTTSETISGKDQAMSDMIEYYTLWAHQIKTPIAAMRLLLQSEKSCEGRDELLMELFKVEQYVEMVLQYLRLDSESTDYIIKEQNVDWIIRESVKKYSTTFIKKKISLEYEETGIRAISDEKWLSFVLEQILSNALKYTYSGKIRIYREKEGAAVLIIEDTGIGIQAEDLPRVFDRGYTGYNGRTDKKSTGIGLYLVQRVMNRLGHTIEIESEVGKGTRVKLDLAYKSVRFE